MRTRTLLRRGVLPLSCLALLTVWTQAGRPQPAPAQVPPPPQVDLPPAPPLPPAREDMIPASLPLPTRPAPAVAPPAAPPTATVEDLIRQLEQLRRQKADLERHERDVIAKLQERMKDQAERLAKLGVVPPALPVPEARDVADGITPLLKR